jgi:hypothetical protein
MLFECSQGPPVRNLSIFLKPRIWKRLRLLRLRRANLWPGSMSSYPRLLDGHHCRVAVCGGMIHVGAAIQQQPDDAPPRSSIRKNRRGIVLWHSTFTCAAASFDEIRPTAANSSAEAAPSTILRRAVVNAFMNCRFVTEPAIKASVRRRTAILQSSGLQTRSGS